MPLARTGVGSGNRGSSCRPTPNSCSGEPHEGALSPSKNDIPIREFPNTFSLRTSAPNPKGLAFLGQQLRAMLETGVTLLSQAEDETSGCRFTMSLPGTSAGTVAQPPGAVISLTP